MLISLSTFIEGILAFISPCVLPMIPIYLTYLMGSNASDNQKPKIQNTLGFILGFTLVFVLLGATATSLGSLLSDNKRFLEKIAGVLIIFFGLHFIGVFKLNFFNLFKNLDFNLKNKGFIGSLLFGFFFSFGWTPCLGTFLGSALLKASTRETVYEGMTLLFLFSMGLGIPFLITSIIFNKLTSTFSWIKRNYKLTNILSGSLLIILGILLLTGYFAFYERLFL
jgi:cytochrome c-type biogenesis protein